ncbi:hypothetical protein TNCT_496881 [Trichonephila clavata]|uniref:Uncharacterized protein n=1 Tax=Trichonephila clavata TaxID=2740835 RepID=A0A8X6LYN9_TRICU|nr:hypothetical protein TNCT_496881 [Trichonephila clavata]
MKKYTVIMNSLKRKMNLQDYNLPGITSENHAFEDEHPVQKDEPVKLKEEINPKVEANYMPIILESVPKFYKIKHRRY